MPNFQFLFDIAQNENKFCENFRTYNPLREIKKDMMEIGH